MAGCGAFKPRQVLPAADREQLRGVLEESECLNISKGKWIVAGLGFKPFLLQEGVSSRSYLQYEENLNFICEFLDQFWQRTNNIFV